MKHLSFPEYGDVIKQWIVVVDFYAQRCPPCKMIAPYLEEWAKQLAGKVSFYKVDTDEQQYLAATEWIRAMPTLKVYNNGSLVKEIVWADLWALQETLNSLLK